MACTYQCRAGLPVEQSIDIKQRPRDRKAGAESADIDILRAIEQGHRLLHLLRIFVLRKGQIRLMRLKNLFIQLRLRAAGHHFFRF